MKSVIVTSTIIILIAIGIVGLDYYIMNYGTYECSPYAQKK